MVKVEINFSNKFVYLVAFIFILIVAVGVVYAVGTGTVPNPGHAIEELEACVNDGETLVMVDGNWVCGGASLSCRVVRSTANVGGNSYAECDVGETALSGGCAQQTITDPDLDAYALWPYTIRGDPQSFADTGDVAVGWGCDSNSGVSSRYAFAVCCQGGVSGGGGSCGWIDVTDKTHLVSTFISNGGTGVCYTTDNKLGYIYDGDGGSNRNYITCGVTGYFGPSQTFSYYACKG